MHFFEKRAHSPPRTDMIDDDSEKKLSFCETETDCKDLLEDMVGSWSPAPPHPQPTPTRDVPALARLSACIAPSLSRIPIPPPSLCSTYSAADVLRRSNETFGVTPPPRIPQHHLWTPGSVFLWNNVHTVILCPFYSHRTAPLPPPLTLHPSLSKCLKTKCALPLPSFFLPTPPL